MMLPCMQSAINSGGKYRTVSCTFTDKVPLVAHGLTRIARVRAYTPVHARACTCIYKHLQACMCVERKEGNDGRAVRKENRMEREKEEEEEHKTRGK